jgi:protein deglycase
MVTGTIEMKVLIMLYEGFIEYEYAIPLMALHYQQIPFEIVGLSHTDIMGMTGLKATTSKTLSEVKAAGYSALLLPGIDREQRDRVLCNEGLLALIREFDQAGKLIAAVCAAPVFLGAAGVLQGRQFCSEVQNHPAFAGAIRSPEPAVRDGHILTGLGARIFHFTALLVEALAGKEKGDEYRRWAGVGTESLSP